MRILIADDDMPLRHGLEVHARKWGYEPILCADGTKASEVLFGGDSPAVALLDRSMPGIDGLTLCRQIRDDPRISSTYVMLLTAHDDRADVMTGLDCGADEYLTKPVDWPLLRARLRVAVRIAALQQSLARRVAELQEALANVKQLQGLLPICCYCKCIRDDSNYWQQLESYVSAHTNAHFSHGVCPTCFERVTQELDA